MFDRDTLIIAYDYQRGEPRKTLAKQQSKQAGGCVDCSLCVQVCPVGIDIRQGLQYECIACAACIDACDSVMESVHKPRGLIRYTSSNHEADGRFRLLRPRTIGYGLVWLMACSGFAVLVLTHAPMRFDVLRDRHTLFREMASGAIENVYQLKVTNDDREARRYSVTARFEDGTPLTVEPAALTREGQQTAATTVTLRTSPRMANGADWTMVEPVIVEIRRDDDPSISARRNARFLTGDQR